MNFTTYPFFQTLYTLVKKEEYENTIISLRKTKAPYHAIVAQCMHD